MSTEQRVRASKRKARNAFYRQMARDGFCTRGVTNWRMLLARQFKIPVKEVRRILGEDDSQ